MLSLASDSFDPLRLCAHFKSQPATRDLPVLIVADFEEEAKALRALDLGASDIIMRPIDTVCSFREGQAFIVQLRKQ